MATVAVSETMSESNSQQDRLDVTAEREESWHTQPLYGEFYGLREAPFDLTPNPRFLFLTARQREALGNLRYALTSAKGFALVLGDAGTGKTTLIRAVLASLSATTNRYVMVNNPTLSRQEFYEFLAREFELSAQAATSKVQFLKELQADVAARAAVGGVTGLIVDEAQSLPHELLEEIRLLGNIETTTTKLLNIVLCGQPELAARLNDSSLRQLKQRLALRCELRSLTLAETASYISGRLRVAGGSPNTILSREAVIAIFEGSRGIPRMVNVICDNALISGFAAQVKPVSVEIVEEVLRDFDLTRGPVPASAPMRPPQQSGHPEQAKTERQPPSAAPPQTADERPLFSTQQAPPTNRRFFSFRKPSSS